MKKAIKIKVVGAIMLATLIFVIGCSDDKSSGQTGMISQVIDNAAEQFVQDVVEASIDLNVVETDNTVGDVSDVIVIDSIMYAVYNGGVVIHDFRTGTSNFIRNGEKFGAVTMYEDEIYVGGDNLYRLFNLALEPVKAEYSGFITELSSYEHRLIIGTSSGLFSSNIFGNEKLMDDIYVNAITADNNGLWIGTNGQGLYRWDGIDFKRRYLIRDTTIFDYVYALDFNHNHLFVGASTGFFINDGGRWDQWTIENGLPSDVIKSIDASDWMVKIGSDSGIIAYFDNNLYPVKKLDKQSARSLTSIGQKLIVGTECDGILVKSGPVLKTLIEPVDSMAEAVFSQTEKGEI